MIVVVTLASVTVFGLDLEPGQKIFLEGESYIIGNKLGEGFTADVYHIHSEQNPDKQFVIRSPRVSVNDTIVTAHNDARNIQDSMKGYSLLTTIDQNQTRWLWTPKIIEVPLNPHRVFRGYEKVLGWDVTHREPVVVIPLAKGTLIDILTNQHDDDLETRLRLATTTYEDLIPELKHLIKAKVIHGDIKPGNILISNEGKAGLSDFEGLVRHGEQTRRATPNYLAPEAEVGDTYLNDTYLNVTSDLYSTAKTLLWILLNEKDWQRLGYTWDSLYRFTQYKHILQKLSQIETARCI